MAGRSKSLDGLFRPRSVAVVGASRRQGAIGRQVVANLVEAGFEGPVYAVNPKTKVVHSMPTYASIGRIPGPVDLAVLVVPAVDVLRVAEACGRKGVKGLVVITAGFREIGGEGVTREKRLLAIARRYGMRVIGPNCMGVINTDPAFSLSASFSATYPSPGAVAMVSQSGALGEAILADATASGIGVSMFASVGNRVDVTAADLIEYWEHDDHVKVILLYIESFGDPAHFVEVARRVTRHKAIIAVKAGRSEAGAAAASSHTGSIAGADIAADTMLAQCGVLRVESLRKMFALAAALLHQPVPKGARIAVVTNAGGPGILATDALSGCGLEMAEFAEATTAALVKALPAEASVQNPVDLIASADADRYRASVGPVIRDKGVDALIVLFVSPIMIDAAAVAQAIVDEVQGTGKPVLAVVMGRSRGDEALEILRRAGIVVYRYPEDAAATMHMLVERGRMLRRKPGKRPRFNVRAQGPRTALRGAKAGWLDSRRAEALLAAYGIPFAKSIRVKEPGDAATAAHEIGFPVVLKAEASDLLHKSDLHAVVTGLHTGDEVFAAAKELLKRLRRRFPDVTLQVQQRAPGHREVLLGMKRDPRYGPLFVAGLGGVQVEVLRDFAVRVGPIDDRSPAEMFESLQGAALLQAFRGDPAADLAAASEVLLRLQQLVDDHPRIAEAEINPFILAAPGQPSVAVDARVRLSE